MPSLVTKHFTIHNAIQFVESFTEAVPSRYFLFVGKSFAFTNDASPPTPVDSYNEVYYEIWKDIIALKRIQISDVSHVVPRYNWANNTLYTSYDSIDANLSSKTFYVLTSDYNVYKCIDNNRNANSTVKPTGTGTSIITTADGYRWKFMYTISGGEITKFLTNDYMPVKTLKTNDSSAQWSVQQAAANGAINHIVITANGSGYYSTSNTFSAVTNSTVVVLANNHASTIDDFYNDYSLFISSGLGSGQIKKIINYVGASRTLTINSAFTITPNTSSKYIISPTVTIRGDSGLIDGIRATAYVSNVTPTSNGSIRKITIIDPGLNYSQANVTITSNSSHGSGASAYSIKSPLNGHGKDPVDELFGSRVMCSVTLSGNTATEGNTVPSNNDIRTIGILLNPILRDGTAANTANIDQTHRLNLVGVSGDFNADEVILGSTSSAKGKFVYFANTNATKSQGTAKLIRVVTAGTGRLFQVGETVTGQTSGVTGVVASYVRPACREFSGLIIYTENRPPVIRNPAQTENYKFVLDF